MVKGVIKYLKLSRTWKSVTFTGQRQVNLGDPIEAHVCIELFADPSEENGGFGLSSTSHILEA